MRAEQEEIATAEEAAASAEELAGQADQLRRLLARFRLAEAETGADPNRSPAIHAALPGSDETTIK